MRNPGGTLAGLFVLLAVTLSVSVRAEHSPIPKSTTVIFTDVGRVEFEPPPRPGLVLRYTIDSLPPNGKSTVYCTPIRVGVPLTVKAAFFNVETGASGPVVSVDCAMPTAEKVPSLPAGATITTTLPSFLEHPPTLAIDGKFGTFYWSGKAPAENDSLTVAFPEAFAPGEIEVTTGKPDGDNTLEHGVLEISEDGANFTEVATFKRGVAVAKLAEKKVKAARVRVTGRQGGWLAVREIAFGQRLPVAAKPAAGINVDWSETPELEQWAARAQKDAEENFAMIAEKLRGEGFVPPRQVMLHFVRDPKIIAHTIGTTITFGDAWIKKHPDDTGTVIHELAHVIQAYRGGKNPGWLVEGIADYIRWWQWEPEARRPKTNFAAAKYTNGYQDAAGFLFWAEKTHDKDLVCKLNQNMRENTYRDALFKDFTGKDLDALWAEYTKR